MFDVSSSVGIFRYPARAPALENPRNVSRLVRCSAEFRVWLNVASSMRAVRTNDVKCHGRVSVRNCARSDHRASSRFSPKLPRGETTLMTFDGEENPRDPKERGRGPGDPGKGASCGWGIPVGLPSPTSLSTVANVGPSGRHLHDHFQHETFCRGRHFARSDQRDCSKSSARSRLASIVCHPKEFIFEHRQPYANRRRACIGSRQALVSVHPSLWRAFTSP